MLRNAAAKRGYKGRLFEALPGDLIISKIRVGQGSFCVIDEQLDHVAVSPEYPVYTPDAKKIDSSYLALVLRGPEFLIQLTGSASGNTTKRRIRPAFFESCCVPLPPLEKQQSLVAAHSAALKRADALECEAGETEARAMAEFEAALGFAPPASVPDRPAFVAPFKDLDRWSHEAILRRIVEGDTAGTPSFPTVHLGDVIADLENGWSPRCRDEPAEPEEWGVLKLGAVSFGVFNPNENKALPKHLEPRPQLEVASGELLISRANITRLVGATALVGETRQKLMLCDKIFRVVPREPEAAYAKFLAEVLRIAAVRRQIEGNVTGTSPTMKNISKPALMSLSFPLPPKSDQLRMTTAVAAARSAAADLRRRAREMRAKAWSDFEAAVYSEDFEAEGASIRTPQDFSADKSSTTRIVE